MKNTPTKTESTPAAARQRESEQDGSQMRYVSPRVNILETTDGYVLEAEMPGVTKDGLEILLDNNELTFIGHREPEKLQGELIYRESTPRDFRRVFSLDPSIDTSKVEAKLQDGDLHLRLPKAESVKPRRITVAG